MSSPIRNRKSGIGNREKHTLASGFWLLISGFWLLTSGCGFQPLYGRPDPRATDVPVDLASIRIAPIPERVGQQFQAALEDRINPYGHPVTPQYELKVTIIPTPQPLGIAQDGTVSRYNLHLDSNFVLTRLSSGEKVLTGNVRRVSGYNNVANAYFSVFIAERDAYNRSVVELAEDYRLRLAAFFAAPAPDAAGKKQEPEKP